MAASRSIELFEISEVLESHRRSLSPSDHARKLAGLKVLLEARGQGAAPSARGL